MTFARQAASGVMRLSGRRIGTCEGFVMEVSAGATDASAEQWLKSLGQLSVSAERRASALRKRGAPEWEVLSEISPVGKARETILTLWVIRLAQAIEEADKEGSPSTVYLEGGQMARAGALPKIGLGRLCLEALARIASRSDMSWINAHLTSHIHLSAGPLHEELIEWFGIKELSARPILRSLLYADPSSAARVTALLRAGVAVIESNDPSMPPPPLKRAVTFSTPPVSPRELAYRDHHGPQESLQPPPEPTRRLDDPLATLESEMDVLESSRAPGPERAEQWKEIATCWEHRFGSYTEAARAYRHAAAAAPDDDEAHRMAARYCARVGRVDLARSHAYAAFALSKGNENRSVALRQCASYAIIDDNIDDALTLLRQGSDYDPDSLEIALVRWSLLASLGRLRDASDAARVAARLSTHSNPRRARALLGWAHHVQPDDVDLAQEFAMSLSALDSRSAGPWLIAESVILRQQRVGGEERISSPSMPIEPARALAAAREQLFGDPDAHADPFDTSALPLLASNAPEQTLLELLRSAPDHPGIQWLAFRQAPQLFFETNEAGTDVERVRKLQASIGEQITTLRYLSDRPTLSVDARRRAHERLCEIAPYDPTLILHRIRFLRETGTVDEWKDAISMASNNELFAGDEIFTDALSGGNDLAPEIALRIYERRGRANTSLGRLCVDYVLRHPESTLLQRYQILDLSADLSAITELARDAEDWAAEARAWLRILEDEPENEGALRRLTRIYTDTGQAKRAYATLCLRLSKTDDIETRSRLLTQIARWAKFHPELEADPESLVGALLENALGSPLQEKVLLLIDTMFQEGDHAGALLGMASRYPSATTVLVHHALQTVPADAPNAAEARAQIVLRALSIVHTPSVLIPTLEHFITQTGDSEIARRGFQTLKERAMGQNGRRALAYREGRILMKIGREKDALQSFSQAFSLLDPPSEGGIYAALKEVSRRTDSWEALAEAQLLLANTSQVPSQRLELIGRAAETFEHHLSNPSKAFDIYLQGWKGTGDLNLGEHAKRVARKLKEADPKLAVSAFGEIVEHLRDLAEGAWDEEERIDKLAQVSALYALDCDAPELASAATEEALKLAVDSAPHRAPGLLCDLATWLLNVYDKPEKAMAYAKRALEFDAEFSAAKALLERGQGSRELLASYPAVHTSLVPIPDTSRPAADLERLREAVRAGDMDAAAALRDILTGKSKYEEAATLQRQILLQDPRRIEDVTRMLDLASLSGHSTLEALADWMQRAFEALPSNDNVRPPAYWPPPPPFSSPIDKELGRGRQLLGAIWRHLGHRWGAPPPTLKTSLRARRTPSIDMSDFKAAYDAARSEPDVVLAFKATEKELDDVLDELGGALGQRSRARTMPTDLSQDGARELSAILSDYEIIPAQQLVDYIRGRCACLALEACSNLVGGLRTLMNENGHTELAKAIEADRALRVLIRHILSDRALSAPARRTTLSPAER